MIIGLTGAIGSGKSTVAKLFAEAGFCIVDCDEISHSIDAEPEYVSAVRNAFGDGVITIKHQTVSVDRKSLAAVVFADDEARKTLQAISHPVILGIVYKRIESARSLGLDTVIDAPLLFESGLNACCDVNVGVIASPGIRKNRAEVRGGISEGDIEARMKVQPSDDFYREKCDYIIENDSSEEELRASVDSLLVSIHRGG